MLEKKFNRKKISQKLEKKLSKKLGGKLTSGSGNKFFDPSDIKWKDFLIEHKFTTKDSYKLTKQTLDKNESECNLCGKNPLFVVEFIDKGTENVYLTYVISKYAYTPDSTAREYFHVKNDLEFNTIFTIGKFQYIIQTLEDVKNEEDNID